MIKHNEPLSMAEATDHLKGSRDEGKEMLSFIKKFSKLKAKEAKELRIKIRSLDLIKLDDKHISKIIDVLPENSEELNKIFVGIGLDEDETKKILDTVKEFE